MTRATLPIYKSWEEFRQGLAWFADMYGEKPEKVLAALDRGGALVNVIAKLAGVDRPKMRRGPKPDSDRDFWLISAEDEGRNRLGLRGKALDRWVSQLIDRQHNLAGLARSIEPDGTRKAHQRARKRVGTNNAARNSGGDA